LNKNRKKKIKIKNKRQKKILTALFPDVSFLCRRKFIGYVPILSAKSETLKNVLRKESVMIRKGSF
jgi:hypothetical protein